MCDFPNLLLPLDVADDAIVLRQSIGYAYLNLVLGKINCTLCHECDFDTSVAIASLVSAGIAFTFLGSKKTAQRGLHESHEHTGLR